MCTITFKIGIKLCITGFFSIWIQQWPVIHLIKGQFFREHCGHTATLFVTDTLCKYYKIIWSTGNSFWQHKMRLSFDLSSVFFCFHRQTDQWCLKASHYHVIYTSDTYLWIHVSSDIYVPTYKGHIKRKRHWIPLNLPINTLRLRQNGRCFPDDIQMHFLSWKLLYFD